jgi:hypothetical protein
VGMRIVLLAEGEYPRTSRGYIEICYTQEVLNSLAKSFISWYKKTSKQEIKNFLL